jgi:tyrosinase
MADIRHNQRDLTAQQKAAFVNAVLALKNDVDSLLHPGRQKRYDDFVEVHKNAMTSGPAMIMPMPHGGPLFYPWHRVLLRQFELALQAAANDPSITLPYWDWGDTSTDNPFTADFLGGDGDRVQNGRVTTGPFSYAVGKFSYPRVGRPDRRSGSAPRVRR